MGTPHTSNVSVGSSITSANTLVTRRRTKQLQPQLILQQDGLQLRHTIEVVSSLLQWLTLSCVHLGELSDQTTNGPGAKGYVEAVDTIKKIYLELVAIQKEDFRALAEAFHLELFSKSSSLSQSDAKSTMGTLGSLAREVSADEDDPKHPPQDNRLEQKERVLALVSSMGSSLFQERSRSDRASPASSSSRDDDNFKNRECNGQSVQQPENLFSPCTQDMRSLTGRDEYIGHNQVSDNFENREGAGQSVQQQPENLFSPCTQDMRSLTGREEYIGHNQVPYEYDDLRRQVGSYDREDNDEREEREGPDDVDPFAGLDDEEEMRRRMYSNVSLAASSMRDMELVSRGRYP